jgi:RNA polymerase sigma factor (sigma-70 family)
MSSASEGGVAAGTDTGLFTTTHWSVVLRARDKSEVALGSLCQSYRQPLLVWLRIRGYSAHDAEDLVQGFFAHLLHRDFLQKVAQEKGAFRTFLLKCLRNYLSDQHDKRSAAKRGSGARIESLDEATEHGHPIYNPASAEPAPDLEYDRAWAQAVLSNGLRRLQAECAQQGHAALCAELEPVMFADESASPYQEIAARLGMSEGAVKTAAHRIRARLKGLVREEVLQTVANENDWQTEVRYLIELFGR